MSAARRILSLAEARSIKATGRRDPEWMSDYLSQVAAALMGGVSTGFLRINATLAMKGGSGFKGSGFKGSGFSGADRGRGEGRAGSSASYRPSARPGPRSDRPRSWPTGRRHHDC